MTQQFFIGQWVQYRDERGQIEEIRESENCLIVRRQEQGDYRRGLIFVRMEDCAVDPEQHE